MSRKRQRQFVALVLLTALSAIAEVVSLGSVIPFLSILLSPEKILHHPWTKGFIEEFGISSTGQLVLPITLAFASLALLAGTVRLLLLWATTKYAFVIGGDISADVYRRSLYQPYRVHLSRNSSEVISGIVNKVNGVVSLTILPSLTLISSVILVVALSLTLLYIDRLISIAALVGFGVTYGFISIISRHRLKENARRMSESETKVIRTLQEGLGGIRDIILDGSQDIYCLQFSQADRTLRKTYASNVFIGGSPRYLVESVGIVLIALLAYTLSQDSKGIQEALPILGAFALGAQRLLPALQNIFSSWASITAGRVSLSETIFLLDQPLGGSATFTPRPSLRFAKSVELHEVYFRYSDSGSWILNGLSFRLEKGSRIGIIGASGGGKSTALDVFMGLLIPQKGELLIDGEPCVDGQVREWQKLIAHVPQMIYLFDATIAENIALGVPPELIDINRVRAVCQKAGIADFIEKSPSGYWSTVGERGVRLSGGQRQRVGIARALYKQASVLVFDEATSALDQYTETSVINALDDLDRDLTIIMVAHRMTTLSRCDRIIEIKSGRVIRTGAYTDLCISNPHLGSQSLER